MITSLASLNCQCGLWCHSWQALICLLVLIFFFTPVHSSHTNLYSISCMLLPPFTCLHHSYFPSSSSFYYWLILPCHLLQAAFPGTQSSWNFFLGALTVLYFLLIVLTTLYLILFLLVYLFKNTENWWDVTVLSRVVSPVITQCLRSNNNLADIW